MANILIVDDDKPLLEVMQESLTLAGHQVTATNDPVRAFIYLADQLRPVPDLFISDVMMPGLDGLSLILRLQREERLKGLKVLIVSARAVLDQTIKKSPNVSGFLDKPFRIDALLGAVASALSKPVPYT